MGCRFETWEDPSEAGVPPGIEFAGIRGEDNDEDSDYADRAFSGHILIPRRFRDYYRGILSREALDRDRR
jgi:hypothetical protein